MRNSSRSPGQQFRAYGEGVDDLDALAGKWTKAQAEEFEVVVASFGEVDPELWVADPQATRGAAAMKVTKPARRASVGPPRGRKGPV